jgi:RNA polymerase sigma-70 factor (ECF subfamily)
MTSFDATTVALVEAVRRNESAAVGKLSQLHQPRLRRAVAARLDRRVLARLDPSDVVQDVLLEAARRLPEYLGAAEMPFFLWLRAIAMSRLIDVHRRNTAGKRNVEREIGPPPLNEESVCDLAECLAGRRSSPSVQVMRREQRDQVRSALARLEPAARELLVMRYVEDLSPGEIAAVLQKPERTVRRHHREALAKLSQLLEKPEDSP